MVWAGREEEGYLVQEVNSEKLVQERDQAKTQRQGEKLCLSAEWGQMLHTGKT